MQNEITFSQIKLIYVPGLNLCPQAWQTFIGVPLPKNPQTIEYPLFTVAREVDPHLGQQGILGFRVSVKITISSASTILDSIP